MIRYELVDEERWISSAQFNRVLAVYQILPGPATAGACAAGRVGRRRGAHLPLHALHLYRRSLCCFGSLGTAIPQVLADAGVAQFDALRLIFVAYGLAGVAIFFLYRALPDHQAHEQAVSPASQSMPSSAG